MYIQLIRHGKTRLNEENRFMGRINVKLSEGGREEVEKAKEKFKDYKIVYSSPMKRCIETAKIIFGNECEIIEVYELREMDFGIFEGKTFKEIISEEKYEDFGSSSEKMYFPDGEMLEDFKKRCIEGIEKIIKNGEDCSVVCHGGVIMSVMEYLSKGKISFYDAMTENAGGFLVEISNGKINYSKI